MEYSICNGLLTVIAADLGAELQSIKGIDGTEYLWQGESGYWGNRAPILFPYVGRLFGGCYILDGNRYSMGIHGFASDSRFSLIFNGTDKMVWELISDERTRAAFPREFVFRVIYALYGKTLKITYETENRDEKPMWFGLGGHPGFRVPLVDGLSFEDYRISFAEPCHPRRIGLSSSCFPDGTESSFQLENNRNLPLRHELFDNDAIILKDISREVTLESEKDRHSVTVRFPQMAFLGIWQQMNSDAPYICLEPWCSLPSTQDQITDFEKKADLICLKPGEIYQNNWEISITSKR